MLHPVAILQILVLASLANGAPVVAKKLMVARFAWPLDGGVTFFDGRPIFGASKTIRGIVVAVLAATLGALLIGLTAQIGAIAGAAAMAGDLFSSFLKRRLALKSSSRATGLDQIPESLFPFLACMEALDLTAADIVIGVALFLVGEILVSRLLFRLHLRDRPY